MTKIKEILERLGISFQNTLFTIAFFTGTILTYFEIDLYRLTFISIYIPLFIWALPGLAFTPVFGKSLPEYLTRHVKKGYLLYQFIFNTLAWGGIVLYLFMWLNFHFASRQQFKAELRSIEDGNYWERHERAPYPYRVVNYKGINKTLIFSQDTFAYELYTVTVVLRKGLFGFDIIESKTLSK